ncbi:MAG: protease modulator HflC, partial [Sphaerochaetaceae bacterium]|nr:protease modulator HflC [Sphaerochaetaceae bacterium]MDD4008032.1 protease modulator HflC [Sphaerochaetaceae bacterium]
YAESEKIKGNADAQATKIYADAYAADPDFFEYWRMLDSYEKTLPAQDKIMSTDMQYFDTMYGRDE